MSLVLHGYYRSSAAYRVRIALNLKKLKYKTVSYHLRNGEHKTDAFHQLNPQELIPALEIDGRILTQSLAILEFLDERFPAAPSFIPSEPLDRARVRALAHLVCCDVHPIDNLRVLNFLKTRMNQDETAIVEWYNHWITLGFTAFENLLQKDERQGVFCNGDSPTLADICLVPQIFNAFRYSFDISLYPKINSIWVESKKHRAFSLAHPDNQPDAEKL